LSAARTVKSRSGKLENYFARCGTLKGRFSFSNVVEEFCSEEK
jgi:hypothetical protein